MSDALDENAVIRAVRGFLEAQGYTMTSVKAGQRGIDLKGAHRSGMGQWFIEAKGATSSRHGSPRFGKEYGSGVAFDRVAKALLTACDLRRTHSGVNEYVGIAIPATDWFDEHSRKIEDACTLLRITIFRVTPDCSVHLSGYPIAS